MKMREVVERLIFEAYRTKKKITFKIGEWFCEGRVERIYEQRIIKFSFTDRNRPRTAFILISDIDEILD